MSDKKVKDILLLWGDLKNKRTTQESMWESITRWCAPDRDFWTVVKENTSEAPRHIFDGTPMSAVTILSNALQGYMASKQTRSFKVGVESFRTLKYKPFEGRMRKYMQDLEDGFYWMINRSNFYEAIGETFKVGGTIGTVTLYADKIPGEERVVNVIPHAHDAWIAENESRVIDTVFRRVHMSARDIVSRWSAKVPESFRTQAETAPYETHEILHAVLPRSTRDVTKIDNLNKPYASYWIFPAHNILLSESGFEENPYISWRWSTPNNGTYGWGPSHSAMAEVLRLNKISKTMTDAAELSVFPALNVPAEQRGKLDLRARGMNPYVDPSRVVTPIQQVGSYPIGRDREQAIEQAVKDHYMVDMFLMMNNYADTTKTATEVMEMQAEKAAIMGAITARIESELFDPLFDRYFEIGMTNGWLPTPPPEAFEVLQGAEIKIDYIGPMSQIQQRFYEKQAIDAPLERVFKYAQLMPELMDVLDPTELGFRLVNESSLPQSLIRDRRTVDGVRQQRAQQQQAALQAENAQKNASAMKDLGDTNAENVQALMSGADPAVMNQMSSGGAA